MAARSSVTPVPGDPVPSSDYTGVCSTFYMGSGVLLSLPPQPCNCIHDLPALGFFFTWVLGDGTQVLMLAPRTKSSSKPGVEEMTQ